MVRVPPEKTSCVFQTAHPVRLLPVRVLEARYFTRDLAQLNLPPQVAAKAAIRLRLQITAAVPFKDIGLDPLVFYLRGSDEFPVQIYEQILSRKSALVLQAPLERACRVAHVELRERRANTRQRFSSAIVRTRP